MDTQENVRIHLGWIWAPCIILVWNSAYLDFISFNNTCWIQWILTLLMKFTYTFVNYKTIFHAIISLSILIKHIHAIDYLIDLPRQHVVCHTLTDTILMLLKLELILKSVKAIKWELPLLLLQFISLNNYQTRGRISRRSSTVHDVDNS